MYDAAKYTDRQLQQQRASINTTNSLYDSPNDVTITNYRYFDRQTLADDDDGGSAESARNGSGPASMATNGWHRESDRQLRSPTAPKSYGVSSLTNGIQPSTSMKHLTSPFDETSRNASSGASATTDQRHRATSSTSINGNNGVNKIAMNSSAKTSPNGLRLNISSFNESDFTTRRASPSQSNDSFSGGRATADNSTPTSGRDGFIDDIEAHYPTDGVTTTTTASTASSSSPGCETPGDESHFLAAAAKPRTSLEGRYRIVSLADQYFPVTFGGECGVNKDGRTVRGRASSASEAATADSASTRRLNGRTQSHHHRHHHHQHRRRHQHRQLQHEHGLDNEHHSRQPQSQRRPGSGHSSSSSRSAASSVDVIYGSVSAVVSPSGDVITLNGGSTVLTSTPYQTELTRLRVDRLRIEEERMAQLTALKKVEISRGPVAKWYELKSPQFHYEAHKNNRQIGAMTDSESPFGVGRLQSGINGSISRTSPAAVTGVSAVTRSSLDV